ncbi:Pkinase-domain-containing protein [Eremomyces bilateralis CBS 781.70]|uniref:Pkinase-domain-containing protein n=1 Tax=Eremomyces bilateralis CBS 781.70 TaxID=1392243 RepID=A0A6G1GBM0_9PEZI|nr:Pkinase-domain-containing protein [Eremomyces bilateralis CBS 781.70]KAF1815372.1 Pkinase-domain-containing protein [Eremomyces bilateralis CBS 781.70]
MSPPKSGKRVLNAALPSPVTNKRSTSTDDAARHDGTATPPSQLLTNNGLASPERTKPSAHHSGASVGAVSSPPQDTQPFSQFIYPPNDLTYEVADEESEGVWGYLVPVDRTFGEPLVLRRRGACPIGGTPLGHTDGRQRVERGAYLTEEKEFDKKKVEGVASRGYLIGRHPECDRIIEGPTVSNRHCLIFSENKGGGATAVIEDLSTNGTYVNDTLVGRNKRRELSTGDEISIVEEARAIFRYPRNRETNRFRQQYAMQEQLGKGHFATVYLCVERSSGMRYAVKKFEKRRGQGERSKVEGLQQEIAVLMGVSHPGLLCLKDTFDEEDGVYIVLELAPEGELFNWIVMKQKLTETEARKVFVQLFQGLKYLHDRNIVHRDIKPENILLTDKNLTIKVADFGLAKIIGEESFTTTLCGTPSYVAPEILSPTPQRRYTRAVDIWSAGVVLYICLCGFPPFSDELYNPQNPYTLAQQIQKGRFDYPSPYWDTVGDAALDLIDRMLTVDVSRRIDIDGCLEHPWTTAQPFETWDSQGASQASLSYSGNSQGFPKSAESFASLGSLTSRVGHLGFENRRQVGRERTLLAALNDVTVSHVIDDQADGRKTPIKVFQKNAGGSGGKAGALQQKKQREAKPGAGRDPAEFMGLGGAVDQTLYEDEEGSRYPDSPATIGAMRGEGQ